ncbi:hypothetical protein RHGRI_001588 [Rhododendron griersonianum]|uniref:Uncharacterized protein n=1 Tax=Rhododendron griersonianum TaxID=479676 RepID=A0AAV6LKP6_9ERIC|nr:hypothetical protein RHGRI_001588 [Rhododendron griersonianum]
MLMFGSAVAQEDPGYHRGTPLMYGLQDCSHSGFKVSVPVMLEPGNGEKVLITYVRWMEKARERKDRRRGRLGAVEALEEDGFSTRCHFWSQVIEVFGGFDEQNRSKSRRSNLTSRSSNGAAATVARWSWRATVALTPSNFPSLSLPHCLHKHQICAFYGGGGV